MAKTTDAAKKTTSAKTEKTIKTSRLGKGLDTLIAPIPTVARDNKPVTKVDEEQTSGSQTMVKLSKIEPNKDQPRQYFDEEGLEELTESIRQVGVVTPILLQDRGDHYEIVAGERRWRAALKAGLKEIPAVIKNYTEKEILEISIIENLQREDISDIEEAVAYKRLMDEFDMTQEEVAKTLGKSRTAVTNKIRLLKLEPEVQDLIMKHKLSEGNARAIIGVTDREEQIALANKIVEDGLNVRDVEKLIRDRNKPAREVAQKSKKEEQLEAVYRSIEETLKQKLGTKVNIVSKGNGAGKIEIEFYDNDELERILDSIRK